MEKVLEHPKHYKYQHPQECSNKEFDHEQMGLGRCHLKTDLAFADWHVR